MIGRCLHKTRDRRQAFTLLEVLLTMSLLVILAALAWPAFDKPFAGRRLRKAADRIRAEWATARVQAIETGQVYLFRYVTTEDRYRIEPHTTDQTQGDSLPTGGLGGTARGLGHTDTVSDRSIERRLPEGVTFVSSETDLDTRAALVAAELEESGLAETGWSDPILFYPDGTSSTARLVLKNDHDRYIEVQIRGLTGVINLSEVRSTEEP